MTIINNMFGGSCLYCSSSHPPRIIEDDPKWCGMDDSKLQTSQAGFLKAQPEHMSQLGEHLTWTIAKALSARIDHVVRKEARNRNKAVSVGASGFACNPNDEEQCRFVDLRDTRSWTFELIAWPQSDETLIRSFFWYPAAMEYAKATTQTLGNQYLGLSENGVYPQL